MKKNMLSAVLLIFAIAIGNLSRAADAPANIAPDEAVQRLTQGHARFLAGKSSHPNADAARRQQTAAEGQHPFATILSCSDSRVPLEVLFDQGIGDIFVIRVAGNVCGVDEMGSIEYGVDHVGTPLLVVLGHSQCGAVTAAAAAAELHGSIKPLVARIAPAVAKAQAAHPELHGKDLVPAATEANVWQSIEELLTKNSHDAALHEIRQAQGDWSDLRRKNRRSEVAGRTSPAEQIAQGTVGCVKRTKEMPVRFTHPTRLNTRWRSRRRGGRSRRSNAADHSSAKCPDRCRVCSRRGESCGPSRPVAGGRHRGCSLPA